VSKIFGNEKAFLEMLSYAEGTQRAPDPYRVCFGYKHTIIDLRDHPSVTGEWFGEILPPEMCHAAGLSSGCKSTAAGKYQIIKPTWLNIKRKIRLPDFSPESQDRGCLFLIAEAGALTEVHNGDIQVAVAKCRRVWASLPGAGYSQPERRLAALKHAFVEAGGILQ
jgi:muramidase (phage lysozyme)